MSHVIAASFNAVVESGVIQLDSVYHEVIVTRFGRLYRTTRFVAVDEPFSVPDVILDCIGGLAVPPVYFFAFYVARQAR